MNTTTAPLSENAELTIIYDGQCPVCSAYTRMARLQQHFGNVVLVDARTVHPAIDQVTQTGLSLNDGMAVIQGDKIYHGAEAMHVLSVMSADYGAFNRVMNWVFRNPTRSARVYPWLVLGRLMLLKLLGRKPIT